MSSVRALCRPRAGRARAFLSVCTVRQVRNARWADLGERGVLYRWALGCRYGVNQFRTCTRCYCEAHNLTRTYNAPRYK